MKISESSKLYLENYFVLEQARSDAHKYLEQLVTIMADEIDEYLEEQNTGEISFRKYIQKDGGHAQFTFERKKPLPDIELVDNWKFSIAYKDAMKTIQLATPTKCKIYCLTPKAYAKQNYELERIRLKLGMPDLFRVVEIDLLDAPVEEVVSTIKAQVIEFYDQFIQIIDELVKENTETNSTLA